MNKARRKAIDAIVEELAGLQAKVEELEQEESEYFDNMPESIQGGERGQRAEEVASELSDIASEVETLAQRLAECAQ